MKSETMQALRHFVFNNAKLLTEVFKVEPDALDALASFFKDWPFADVTVRRLVMKNDTLLAKIFMGDREALDALGSILTGDPSERPFPPRTRPFPKNFEQLIAAPEPSPGIHRRRIVVRAGPKEPARQPSRRYPPVEEIEIKLKAIITVLIRDPSAYLGRYSKPNVQAIVKVADELGIKLTTNQIKRYIRWRLKGRPSIRRRSQIESVPNPYVINGDSCLNKEP